MATPPDERGRDPAMDSASLYREEVYTDRKVGTLRVLNPVKPDGSPDATRETIYTGEAQVLTPAGALPISFDVPAASLAAAVDGYAAAAKVGLEQVMRELKELRRQQQSSLVIPQGGGGVGGMGGLGGLGGLPGGGKIQLP